MTPHQQGRLKEYRAATYRCTETCGKHFPNASEYELHVLACQHIFPAVREALQRQKDRGLPVVALDKSRPRPPAEQPPLFEIHKTHRKRR